MTRLSVIWGSPQWMTVALAFSAVAAILILWSYSRAATKRSVKVPAALLKALAFAALAVCLLEPLLAGTRPRRGANAFVILADNSQSLLIRDDGDARTRGERLRDGLEARRPLADAAGTGL